MSTPSHTNPRPDRPHREPTGLLRWVVNAIPQRVFWKDRHSVYLGCNRRFAEDVGLVDPEDIIGLTDFDLPWRAQAELYRGDDRRLMEAGTAEYDFEEPNTARDGRSLILRTSKVPLRDEEGRVIGILGLYEDITLVRRAEELLRLREAALMATESSVAIMDRQGGIVWANPAFNRISGYSISEAPACAWPSLENEIEDAGEWQRLLATVQQGETWKGEMRCRRKDGSIVELDATVSGVPDSSGRYPGHSPAAAANPEFRGIGRHWRTGPGRGRVAPAIVRFGIGSTRHHPVGEGLTREGLALGIPACGGLPRRRESGISDETCVGPRRFGG